MRLLRCDNTQILSFKAFVQEDEVPPYAILSHTWQEGEEVTYYEMIEGSYKDKTGYDKIRFCAQQAKRDGLEYFWVDTCCINKADQVELRDALSSMFHWYQNAARCYVFLSDVSIGEQKTDSEAEFASAAAFRASRWFTRGWTLQELLAPGSVDFFSKEWRRLGDKTSLQRFICEATRIPDAALQGAPLSQFSVNERLKWSEHRETKLAEDRAYCLMGILGVYISPFEGEGAGGAFRRLMDEVDKLSKCLQDIRLTDPRDDKKRIENTKGGLLEGSYRWVLHNANFQQWHNDPQSRLLWVKGDPGKGKTMLLCGVINELQKSIAKSSLLCYFFCQATDSRINSAIAVLRGLLYLLVSQQPALASHIRKRYDYAGKSLFEDANAWVALTEIFADVLRDPSLNTMYLIVDALDECVTDLPRLLEFVAKQSSSASSRIKWIVSSRNWPDIEEQLERAGHKVRLSLELNAESVATAVGIFIQQKVSQLAQQKQYDERIRNAVLEHLTSNSNDTFLWVALVCQDLQTTARRNVLKRLNLFPPGLDSLYGQMMQQIKKLDDAELCKQVLASITLVYRPVTLKELVALVEQLEELADADLREIIGLCGSFLTLQEESIYFVHKSAKDFLLARAAKDLFLSGKDDVHYTIFARSLKILSRTLQRDMYGLEALGYLTEDVRQLDPNLDPLAASRYSCVYWVDHLHDSNIKSSTSYVNSLQDGGVIDVFLREKYLYWLEGLSLCKGIPKGIISMAKLWSLVQGREDTTKITELIKDAHRFIMSHKVAIENSPLQVYASALLFSPARSLVKELFAEEAPKWITIKPAVADDWSACLQTLEGHTDVVNSVAFCHDATRLVLASASHDQMIKIWDASSGECLQTLEGQNDWVNSVAFSYNAAWLASASFNDIVKIWDASSGECLQTLEGHSNSVNSVAFSHDATQLASASNDKTIKIWDASSGKCLHTLKDHSDFVASVAYNATWLASASVDKTIKIWDASSGKCLQTLEGHSSHVNSIAFSHATWLASASSDGTVKIWDTSSGECLRTLEDHSSFVTSVAFSHDTTRLTLASASHDNTVKIWDASSGKCLQTLKGHNRRVTSVAFSYNATWLASASFDNTVKIWDVCSSEYLQAFEDHSNFVSSVAFSYDATRLASASSDGTVKIWDTSSSECLQTLKGHSIFVNSVAFSHDTTRLTLASASHDRTVKIWDASSGECLQTLEGHSDSVASVAFSHDATQLASASHDTTVKIWDASSGKCLQTLEGHSTIITSVAFSHATWLASASNDKTVKIWDASSGKCLHTLKDHSNFVTSVAFSHDTTRLTLASASHDKTVKIWDASSGECLKTLEVGQVLFRISFDISNSRLHTEIGTVDISTPPGSETLPTASESHNPQYQGLGLSKDGVWVTYNSKNLVWLPSEYRPSCSAISGKTISIGVGSGKVWICKVELDASKDI